MPKLSAALLSLLVTVLAALGAAAAEPTKSATAPSEPSAAQPINDRGTSATPKSGPDGTPAVIVDDDKVESLLGKIVTSSSGDKLGQITDVLVGHAGDIRAAVVDFGGFLGVGTRKVAVAWKSLKFSDGATTLDMTRDELRVTPEYREREPIVIVGPSPAQTSSDALPATKVQK